MLNKILNQVDIKGFNKSELKYYCRLKDICIKQMDKQYSKRQIQDLFM